MKKPGTIACGIAALGATIACQRALGQVSPDYDGDGRILPADIAMYADEWYRELSGAAREADTDEDSHVTPADVALFMQRWSSALTGVWAPPGPRAPNHLVASVQSNSTTVLLAWTDRSNNETGFELIRQVRVLVGGIEDYVQWTVYPRGVNQTTFTDTRPAGTYRYMVRAVGATGNSYYTPWLYVTAGGAPPPPPPPTATGACCTGTTCTVLTAAACATAGGSYRGDNVACTTTTCQPVSSTGWTNFPLPSGSRQVFVSSSTGNDASSGLDASHPVRSLSAAMSLLRNGTGDQALLKKGDTWSGEVISDQAGGGAFHRTGLSAAARMVVGSYGTGARVRVIGPGDGEVLGHFSGQDSSGNLALVGVAVSPPSTPGGIGLYWTGFASPDNPGGGHDILVEDCSFSGYYQAVALEGPTRFTMRRSSLLDCFSSAGSVSVGLYAGGCRDLLIDDCLFDRNGWNATHPPDMFKHNLYIQDSCPGFIFRKCISTNGGADGGEFRSGGLIQDSVFARNPTAFKFGGNCCDNYFPQGISGTVSGCVVLEGTTLNGNTGYGVGMWCMNISAAGVTIDNCIIANKVSGEAAAIVLAPGDGLNTGINKATVQNTIVSNWTPAFRAWPGNGRPLSNVTVTGNIFQNDRGGGDPLIDIPNTSAFHFTNNVYYDSRGQSAAIFSVGGSGHDFNWWKANVEPTATWGRTAFPNPAVSLATYAQSIGVGTTMDSLLTALRNRSRDNWPANLDTSAILAYLRAGFGR